VTLKKTILQIIDGSGWLHEWTIGGVSDNGFVMMTHEPILALALVELIDSDDGEEAEPWREMFGIQRDFGESDFGIVDNTTLVPSSECSMDGSDPLDRCPRHPHFVGRPVRLSDPPP
jgi:hypothetical protein